MAIGSNRTTYAQALNEIYQANARLEQGDSREEAFSEVSTTVLNYVMENQHEFDAWLVDAANAELEARWDAAHERREQTT